MKFSVIVPVHNAEKYISEATSSIVKAAEGMENCIEVLLIENGSTDRSGYICGELANRFPFVKTVHMGPASAYDARQEGIKRASGDYLVFMDADDAVAPGIFTELQKAASKYERKGKRPEIILYNAAEMSTPESKMFPFPFKEGKIYSGDGKKKFYEIMCSGDMLNAMWNKCIGKELAGRIEETVNRKLNYGEDLLQTAEIIDKAKSIAYLDRILYFYRINEEGLTGGYHENFMENQEKAFEVLDDYAKKWAKGGFTEVINERKTLTCTIGMKKLIYSDLPFSEIKRKMKEMMGSDFYKEYGKGKLPSWASEEDAYVYRYQVAGMPVLRLMLLSRKTRLKSRIKARIRKNGI
ncbi:Glycosyl transferase family 2 [Butyrivibrio sp. ob235]|uniref:glycosyltransferase family 2 protein n=1 Tax=Butyrivibrio sp. ob235 TaxID=1761780 RepID=UPI0008AE6F78|nr:glycosyltransferase family 2 protein [Butyrivibrio sp. ob235]SEK79161.1 Glycosyl transferase family 2 [Butyrivibrio sp. ob235]